MKLSEAIKLGSEKTEQAFSKYIDRAKGEACALGAAMVAADLKRNSQLKKLWPWAFEEYSPDKPQIHCPHKNCSAIEYNYSELIIHMNDDHQDSREKIAKYIEKIEAKLECEVKKSNRVQ
jgi:hypothetical protein